MSAIQSMFNYLSDGNEVTTRQARTLFKVENVSDLVYRLRNEGVAIYTNRTTTSRGEKTFSYRIGNPSEQFSKYFESRHIARARKALYRNAISVTMG
jgi:Helix-turn-helix domain